MDEPSTPPPSKQPKRFFDVSPPKDFTPSATSRPLIVGHHPEQADPMMTPQQPLPTTTPEVEPPPVTMPESAPEQVAEPEVAPASFGPTEDMMQEEYAEVAHELPSGENEEQVPSPEPLASTDSPAVSTPAIGQAVVVHHKPPASMGKKLVIALVIVVIVVLIAVILLKMKQNS